MNQFGTKMKQKYKEYNGQEPITTLAGEKYPDDLSKRTFKLYSDNCKKTETIDIGWVPSLKKDYDYHVFLSLTATSVILSNTSLICSAFMMDSRLP